MRLSRGRPAPYRRLCSYAPLLTSNQQLSRLFELPPSTSTPLQLTGRTPLGLRHASRRSGSHRTTDAAIGHGTLRKAKMARLGTKDGSFWPVHISRRGSHRTCAALAALSRESGFPLFPSGCPSYTIYFPVALAVYSLSATADRSFRRSLHSLRALILSERVTSSF